MFRRLLTLVVLAAILAAVPQSALALSAGEALFGDSGAPVADAGYDSADDYTEVELEDGDEDDVDPDDLESAVDEEEYAGSTAEVGQYPTLRLGDRDGDDGMAYIVFMQNRLNELGYLRDSADGVFYWFLD